MATWAVQNLTGQNSCTAALTSICPFSNGHFIFGTSNTSKSTDVVTTQSEHGKRRRKVNVATTTQATNRDATTTIWNTHNKRRRRKKAKLVQVHGDNKGGSDRYNGLNRKKLREVDMRRRRSSRANWSAYLIAWASWGLRTFSSTSNRQNTGGTACVPAPKSTTGLSGQLHTQIKTHTHTHTQVHTHTGTHKVHMCNVHTHTHTQIHWHISDIFNNKNCTTI